MVNLVGMGQIWKGQKKKKIVRNGVQKVETGQEGWLSQGELAQAIQCNQSCIKPINTHAWTPVTCHMQRVDTAGQLKDSAEITLCCTQINN